MLERLTRYFALVDDNSELVLEVDGGVARLVSSRRTGKSPRAATELLFAVITARVNELTQQRWSIREVTFRQPAPRDARPHEAFFGAPVRFGCARSEIVFDASWLEVASCAHDRALGTYLERQLEQMLAHLPKDAFIDSVRQGIAEGIRGAEPSLEATAKRLRMGARTLQRRLGEHGTSHTEQVEEVRRELAAKLLADTSISVGEAAYLLGFFDASTFNRASSAGRARRPPSTAASLPAAPDTLHPASVVAAPSAPRPRCKLAGDA